MERQAEAAAEAARVLDEIRHLPRRERDVLALSVWEGLSHAEIADTLGIGVGTVKSRLARARARLDPSRRPAAARGSEPSSAKRPAPPIASPTRTPTPTPTVIAFEETT